ncbi:acyl transferase [Psychroflexus sp. ALD_RP9]|uniref:LuxE/PaaK family acyltransferase n=1 Tax=Psychroflexus sp. ALD_RP9 TaxID=2777186 RepID=UPI001A8EC40B|nr:acyl transferase [Psychroflexus sp. ALD_RP9]QSS96183.1 acyl transferase [Psychroflexus sp. ALD_RP9]
MMKSLENNIFAINSNEDFIEISLEVFRFQYENCKVYREFCDFFISEPDEVTTLEKIPFLPIEFFKKKHVISFNTIEKTFLSSGTTGQIPSQHFISDLSLYERSFLNTFKQFYGDPEDFVILALLPSYLEREGSSLIYMVDNLIKKSKNKQSGFYLHNIDELVKQLDQLKKKNKKVLLIGVSFALLDLAEAFQDLDLSHCVIMETGGMKGRRKEMTRHELHTILTKAFNVKSIHSEYGMTELLSQAYSLGDGIFKCPKHLRFLIRDPEDALNYQKSNKTGGINVIDLANLYSCSFIATQDLGKVIDENSYEILGRFDQSDVRGCNLMAL